MLTADDVTQIKKDLIDIYKFDQQKLINAISNLDSKTSAPNLMEALHSLINPKENSPLLTLIKLGFAPDDIIELIRKPRAAQKIMALVKVNQELIDQGFDIQYIKELVKKSNTGATALNALTEASHSLTQVKNAGFKLAHLKTIFLENHRNWNVVLRIVETKMIQGEVTSHLARLSRFGFTNNNIVRLLCMKDGADIINFLTDIDNRELERYKFLGFNAEYMYAVLTKTGGFETLQQMKLFLDDPNLVEFLSNINSLKSFLDFAISRPSLSEKLKKIREILHNSNRDLIDQSKFAALCVKIIDTKIEHFPKLDIKACMQEAHQKNNPLAPTYRPAKAQKTKNGDDAAARATNTFLLFSHPQVDNPTSKDDERPLVDSSTSKDDGGLWALFDIPDDLKVG